MSAKSDVLMQQFRHAVYERLTDISATSKAAPADLIARRANLFREWQTEMQPGSGSEMLPGEMGRHWVVADVSDLRKIPVALQEPPLAAMAASMSASHAYGETLRSIDVKVFDQVRFAANSSSKTVMGPAGNPPAVGQLFPFGYDAGVPPTVEGRIAAQGALELVKATEVGLSAHYADNDSNYQSETAESRKMQARAYATLAQVSIGDARAAVIAARRNIPDDQLRASVLFDENKYVDAIRALVRDRNGVSSNQGSKHGLDGNSSSEQIAIEGAMALVEASRVGIKAPAAKNAVDVQAETERARLMEVKAYQTLAGADIGDVRDALFSARWSLSADDMRNSVRFDEEKYLAAVRSGIQAEDDLPIAVRLQSDASESRDHGQSRDDGLVEQFETAKVIPVETSAGQDEFTVSLCLSYTRHSESGEIDQATEQVYLKDRWLDLDAAKEFFGVRENLDRFRDGKSVDNIQIFDASDRLVAWRASYGTWLVPIYPADNEEVASQSDRIKSAAGLASGSDNYSTAAGLRNELHAVGIQLQLGKVHAERALEARIGEEEAPRQRGAAAHLQDAVDPATLARENRGASDPGVASGIQDSPLVHYPDGPGSAGSTGSATAFQEQFHVRLILSYTEYDEYNQAEQVSVKEDLKDPWLDLEAAKEFFGDRKNLVQFRGGRSVDNIEIYDASERLVAWRADYGEWLEPISPSGHEDALARAAELQNAACREGGSDNYGTAAGLRNEWFAVRVQMQLGEVHAERALEARRREEEAQQQLSKKMAGRPLDADEPSIYAFEELGALYCNTKLSKPGSSTPSHLEVFDYDQNHVANVLLEKFDGGDGPSPVPPVQDGAEAAARHGQIQNGFLAPSRPADAPSAPTPTDPKKTISDILENATYKTRADGSVLYLIDNRPAFVDHGEQILMEPKASDDEEAILAAALLAKEKFGGAFELTGSDEFKRRAIEILLKHDIEVKLKHPHQEALRRELTRAGRPAADGPAPALPPIGADHVPAPSIDSAAASNGTGATDANGEPVPRSVDPREGAGSPAPPTVADGAPQVGRPATAEPHSAEQTTQGGASDPRAAGLIPVRAIDWWTVQHAAIHAWSKSEPELQSDLAQLGPAPADNLVFWFDRAGDQKDVPAGAGVTLAAAASAANRAGFKPVAEEELRSRGAKVGGEMSAKTVLNVNLEEFDMAARPESNEQEPKLILRGVKKLENGDFDTTVLLFKGKGDYLQGFVKIGDQKHQVLAHINERKPDQATGEVKPNFLKLSEPHSTGEDTKWKEIGFGNAVNRRKDEKPVYFDEVLFSVGNEVVKARVTKNVDDDLHRQLGFDESRKARPKEAGRAAPEGDEGPKLRASAAKEKGGAAGAQEAVHSATARAVNEEPARASKASRSARARA